MFDEWADEKKKNVSSFKTHTIKDEQFEIMLASAPLLLEDDLSTTQYKALVEGTLQA